MYQCGNQPRGSQKISNRTVVWPSYNTLGYIPNGLHILLHRHLQMPIVRWMGKENVVHIITEYYSSVKKSEVTKSASKWVELENTNLVTSPRPVQKFCMLSLKCRSWLCFVCRSQETRKGAIECVGGYNSRMSSRQWVNWKHWCKILRAERLKKGRTKEDRKNGVSISLEKECGNPLSVHSKTITEGGSNTWGMKEEEKDTRS